MREKSEPRMNTAKPQANGHGEFLDTYEELEVKK
jgi:hypothetical protein